LLAPINPQPTVAAILFSFKYRYSQLLSLKRRRSFYAIFSQRHHLIRLPS